MSASSVSSSTGSTTTGYQLGSLTGTTQITGLASGLDTDQIIQEEMAIYQQPVTRLQDQQSGLTALNTQLTNIQTQLQTLVSDAQALTNPSLYATSQAVTSSDPTRVTGSTGTGAGVGSYQVEVTQLAGSARRTYTFASPSSDDTITIGGQQVTISAGESISDFVNSINANSNLNVYAAATDSGTVVLSSRQTGSAASVSLTDAGTALTEQTQLARAGQDAQFTVDGGTQLSSSTNTVTNAIPGVTLTFDALTTTSGAVTVNVGAPAPSTANIQNAIQTFITQYNSVIGAIQAQLSQPPSGSDPSQGTLHGDAELSQLLSSMRSMMYAPGGGLPTGLATMMDIGVSTGATTGTGAVSQNALSGDLTLDATALANQLASHPSGVRSVLNSWSITFSNLVANVADPAGTIDQRIQGDDRQISQLGNRISVMQSALNERQNMLVQQFAQLEAALSGNQSTSSWLASQLAALPGMS